MSKWRVLALARPHPGFWVGDRVYCSIFSVQDCYLFDQGQLTTQLFKKMMISEKKLFLRGTTNFEQGKHGNSK